MKKLFTTTLSALLILTLTSIPGAFANPGHSVIIAPILAGPGATFLVDIRVATADPSDIVGPCTFLTYDPGEDDPLPPFSSGVCASYCVAPAVVLPDRCWRLNDVEGENVGAQFPAGSTCGVIDLDVGNGDPATSAGTFAVTPPCVVFDPVDGGLGNPPDGAVTWDEIPGGGPESTLGLGLYRVTSFGFVDSDGDALFSSVLGDTPGEVRESFRVSQPTAGEIVPIDTSALFIAGIGTNPLIMLSTLGILAVAAFGILRTVVIRNN